MSEVTGHQLNPPLSEEDLCLFNGGHRLSKLIADLGQARFDLGWVEGRRVQAGGGWNAADSDGLRKVVEQLSAITEDLGAASEILSEACHELRDDNVSPREQSSSQKPAVPPMPPRLCSSPGTRTSTTGTKATISTRCVGPPKVPR